MFVVPVQDIADLVTDSLGLQIASLENAGSNSTSEPQNELCELEDLLQQRLDERAQQV